MIKKNIYKKHATSIKKYDAVEGETIEEKIIRIISSNEPIKDGAPIIYTERKQGVLPEMDIRTDRFEVALDAMDKVDKSYKAKREERHNPKKQDDAKKEDGKADSIHATN